jgi:DNA-binding NtrC family response regulator
MNDRRDRNRPTLARPLVTSSVSTSTKVQGSPPSSPSTEPSAPPTSSASAAPSSAPSGKTVARAMMLMRGPESTTIALDDRERYVLGRHDAADVVFDDGAVSRLHGVLACVDGRWTFQDYGSHNGTQVVRGQAKDRVVAHAPVDVFAGDVLELGGETSRVRLLERSVEQERHSTGGTEVSAAARAFDERLRLAARTRVPVFLLGASGVGKTYSARRIHELSHLPGAFVPVNCARLPHEPTALHSELLGHVRGAYTGAEGARTGKLPLADGGTLFLDEVESLPPVAQGFLLDVLEGSGDLAPLGAGAVRLKPLTFRLVSASKKPLAESGLRVDLCERLAEGHLWRVPGLQERTADIPGLLARFASEQAKLLGVEVVVTSAAVKFCQQARWPGQVRMLRASVVALAQLGLARRMEAGREKDIVIELRDVDFRSHLFERNEIFGEVDVSVPTRGDARRLTRRHVEAALLEAGGNQVHAAMALGIARNTLRRKLAER